MPNRNRFPDHERRNRPHIMKTRQAKRLRRRLRALNPNRASITLIDKPAPTFQNLIRAWMSD